MSHTQSPSDNNQSPTVQHSIEHYAALVRKKKSHTIQVIQTENGTFEYHHNTTCVFIPNTDKSHLELHHEINITERKLCSPSLQYGRHAPQSISLCFITGQQTALMNGHTIDTQLLVMAYGADIYCALPANISAIIIDLPIVALEQLIGEQTACDFLHCAAHCLLLKSNRAFESYKQQCLTMARQCLQQSAPIAAEAQFPQALQSLLKSSIPLFKTPKPAARHRLVSKTFERLNKVRLTDLPHFTVTALCQQLHCSKRSLEYAFKQTLGITPKYFLQLLHLHQVRLALQLKHYSSWQHTLLHYGITNSARFSTQYHALFSEHPKTTFLNHERIYR